MTPISRFQRGFGSMHPWPHLDVARILYRLASFMEYVVSPANHKAQVIPCHGLQSYLPSSFLSFCQKAGTTVDGNFDPDLN